MKYSLFLIVIFFFITPKSYSQGCSDAGACSIEHFSFDNEKTPLTYLKLDIEQSFGLGEKFIFISQTNANISYSIKNKISFELKVPYIFTYGNLGQSNGPGDLLLSANAKLFSTQKSNFGAVIAGRFKTNDADKRYNSIDLPMAYQTSLGTNDVILAFYNAMEKWDFYAAWQHPFGNNQNNYLQNPLESNTNKLYYESNKLKRGDDAYLRVRRSIKLKNTNKLTITALAIYRLQKDEIIKNDVYQKLDGSDGLTLNLAVNYLINLKNSRKLDLSLAFPIKDKPYRADGLTRNVVISLKLINL